MYGKVDPVFEHVKLRFDQVSIRVAELTAQSNLKEDSPIPVAIDEKHSPRRTVFLGQFGQKRSH
jgi:hypothetical protein